MATETVDPADEPGVASEGDVRTAVLIVHGLGEKRPMDVLDAFAKTALSPRGTEGEQRWDYYSQPPVLTDSYEARRYIARPPGGTETEIYEYHWPYLMTASRYAGAMAMTMRLLFRRPSNVPDPLFGIWRVVWSVFLAILLSIPALFVVGYLLDTDVPHWIVGLIFSAVVLMFWFGLFRMVGALLVNRATKPFVEVVRYLDPTPDSYAARRATRAGLVDLLRDLHDGRYSRIVVVGHSVGAFISYDALMSFWAETHASHAAEEAADGLMADGAVDEFQDRQFALWQDLRQQGNPWRITDFITIGSPMALADLLLTRPGLFSGFKRSDPAHRREMFDELVARGALVRCPPRSETLPVGSTEQCPASYRSRDDEVLGSQSVFAPTRWTNIWFPVVRGKLPGDWFGGPLRPLFGPGIRDIAALGNTPERLQRGSAHSEYFRHPEKADDGDVAWQLRKILALQTII